MFYIKKIIYDEALGREISIHVTHNNIEIYDEIPHQRSREYWAHMKLLNYKFNYSRNLYNYTFYDRNGFELNFFTLCFNNFSRLKRYFLHIKYNDNVYGDGTQMEILEYYEAN